MPTYDAETLEKLDQLRELRRQGIQIEVFELVKIEWPEPTGTIYYSSMAVDEAASVAPFSHA